MERQAQKFPKILHKAIRWACPLVEIKNPVKEFKWWQSDLNELRSKVRRAGSVFRHRNSERNWNALQEARRAFWKAIRRSKRKCWQTFTGEANNPKMAAVINRIVKGNSKVSIGLLRPDKDSTFKSPVDSVKMLLDEHFPKSRSQIDFQPCPPGQVEWNRDGPAGFITTWKVEKAIKSFGNYKAPGPDDIRPVLLKHLGPKALAMVTNMFRASYLLAYQPLSWRSSRVVFIPKPGKGDYSLPRSFRPITLSSFVMKVMERLILWRLEEVTFVERPLSTHQHASRRQRSTDSALTNMVGYIESALQRDEFAMVVFLDIKGAFDNVNTLSVVQGMEEKGVEEHIVKWYKHYLQNRQISVDVNGVTEQRQLLCGTPQGGVLSPVAWNLIFDLLLQLFQGWVKAVGFADDAGLVTTGKNLASRMQKALREAEGWGKDHGISFSPAKTVAVIFTRKHKFNPPSRLMLDGTMIPYSDQAKYLGVLLDRKLLWTPHVTKKIASAKGHLVKLRQSMGKLWGVPPFMTRWLYTGVVRPALSYGSLVWARATEKKTIQDRE